MRGKLVVLSGPSGVGKGTIRKDIGFDNYVFSISSTTRSIRPGEINGVDYHFISREKFLEKVKKGEMLEHAEFAGNLYGTDKLVVDELLDAGKNVLLEIECQGAIQVISQIPDVVSIFILPPSLEELELRLRNRATETEEKITLRLEKAKEELMHKELYKYCIVNDNLKNASKELEYIFTKELDEIE